MSDDNPQSEEPAPSTGADPRASGWHPTIAPETSTRSERSESSSSTPGALSQASLGVAPARIASHEKLPLRIALTMLLGIIALAATVLLVECISGPSCKVSILVISVLGDGLAVFALIWLWRERSVVTSDELSGYSPPEAAPVWPDTSAVSKGKPRIPTLPLVGEIHALQGYAQGRERGWRFRLQCYDNAGNPFAPLPVEIPIAKDKGGLLESDRVEVKGRWRRGTGIRAWRIRNLETGIDIKGARLQVVARTGYVLMGLGIVLIVLYFLSSTNWFKFLSQSFISQRSTVLLSLSLFFVGALLVMIVKVKE